MADYLEFQTGEENHWDIGKEWVGYIIAISSEATQEPGGCIECKKWFQKREGVHSVRDRYVYHEVEGHEVREPKIGSICQGCFEKARSAGQFRKGIIRGSR